MKINPCKCGSPANVEWSSCTETSTGTWQMCAIECSNVKCHRDVCINVLSHDGPESKQAEAAAIETWNRLFGVSP